MSDPTRITLRAFRAPEQPDLCHEFMREHRKVLEDFGIAHVPANNENWFSDEGSFVIVAMHDILGMVGGIRLQTARSNEKLSMEASIEKLDPHIHDVLEDLRPFGNGEVCGLWNANRFASKGIPVLLSQAVTAISVPAGLRKMVCFVAHYTQKHPKRNGFIVMEEVGDKGMFPAYPIPEITAIAMVNPDTMLLEHASIEHRQLIYSLRLRPEQVRLESPGGEPMEIHYHLQLNTNTIDLYAYRQIEAERLRFTA